jgi:hypothetical protein
VGTIQYLFLNLDYGPSDEVLEWACKVVEDHPQHNVIITTHAYILGSGKFISAQNHTVAPTLTGGYNDGPEIWDKLVKKYANIVMVVCGHIQTRPQIVAYEVEGDNGNKIQHVLVNPSDVDEFEGSSGLVALFHFSADGKTVQVENYATIKKMHFGPGLTFTLNSLGGNAYETPSSDPEPAQPHIVMYICGACAVAAVAVISVIAIRKKVAKRKN